MGKMTKTGITSATLDQKWAFKCCLVFAVLLSLVPLLLACNSESIEATSEEKSRGQVIGIEPESIQTGVTETMEVTDFTIIAYQGQDILGGNYVELSEVLAHGKPVVLNFWGARCPPCRDELPRLQKVYEGRQQEVLFLGVDVGAHSGLGSMDEGMSLLKELDIGFPAGTTPDRYVMKEYELYAIPTTFFLTRSGTIWSKKQGWADEDELNRLINGLVAYDISLASGSDVLTPTPSPVPGLASGTPSRNRSLVMAGKNPFTLDPAMSFETYSHTYVSHLFRGLMRFDSELNLRGDLAESFEVASSGTVYKFKIREGASFHDGRFITAGDVQFSFERATDPSLKSPTARHYLGDIVGVNEKLRGMVKSISGIKVLNDRVIEITIDGPKPYFLAKLTYPTAAIVDRKNVIEGGREWWRAPNGSGPFMLHDWQEDEILILEKYPNFKPVASKLEFAMFLIPAGFQMRMYEAGLLDVAYLSGTDIDRAMDPSSGIDGQLTIFPELNTYFVGFNMTKPPFDDHRVRRAFAMALNRERFIEIVHRGRVEIAVGILPPGLPGYSPDVKGIPFDPEGARQLILEAGYSDVKKLPTITYTIPGIGGALGDGTSFLIQEWRENLGVEVEVRQIPFSAYFYRLYEQVDNLFDYGWLADYPDPENFLDALFHSETSETLNVGGYSNGEVDRLLEVARIEQDISLRFSWYRAAEQTIVDEAAFIPMYHDREYVLVKPGIDGFMIDPLGVPILQNVSIRRP
jgi:oligopeptide transport system substrate-binding protein